MKEGFQFCWWLRGEYKSGRKNLEKALSVHLLSRNELIKWLISVGCQNTKSNFKFKDPKVSPDIILAEETISLDETSDNTTTSNQNQGNCTKNQRYQLSQLALKLAEIFGNNNSVDEIVARTLNEFKIENPKINIDKFLRKFQRNWEEVQIRELGYRLGLRVTTRLACYKIFLLTKTALGIGRGSRT